MYFGDTYRGDIYERICPPGTCPHLIYAHLVLEIWYVSPFTMALKKERT